MRYIISTVYIENGNPKVSDMTFKTMTEACRCFGVMEEQGWKILGRETHTDELINSTMWNQGESATEAMSRIRDAL